MNRRLGPVGQAAVDALRRFPHYSARSLAMYLMRKHPGLFSTYEAARTAIRVCCGVKKNSSGIKRLFAGVPVGAGRARLKLPESRVIQREDYSLPYGTWGIISDLHLPFYERKPFETVLNWFAREKITGLLLNGDFQDCEALGIWAAPALRKRDFAEEVELTADMLGFLRQEFPKAKIIWKFGNHEERLQQYYSVHAPELADLPTATLEEILKLDVRGIETLSFKQRIRADELIILHGHEMRARHLVVQPARWALLRAKACVAIGHLHQTSATTENALDDRGLSAWSFGCLCDLHPDYNPWGNQWNWGAAILWHPGKSEWLLENRRVLQNGKLV